MKVEKVPDSTYDMIGGLDQQIKEIKEVRHAGWQLGQFLRCCGCWRRQAAAGSGPAAVPEACCRAAGRWLHRRARAAAPAARPARRRPPPAAPHPLARTAPQVIELPLKHPELFESLGIAQPKGVLLYGPPGTGKTLLARAVAHHTDCTFIRVSGSELVQKYIGEGSRMVRELFVMARCARLGAGWAGDGLGWLALGGWRWQAGAAGLRQGLAGWGWAWAWAWAWTWRLGQCRWGCISCAAGHHHAAGPTTLPPPPPCAAGSTRPPSSSWTRWTRSARRARRTAAAAATARCGAEP